MLRPLSLRNGKPPVRLKRTGGFLSERADILNYILLSA